MLLTDEPRSLQCFYFSLSEQFCCSLGLSTGFLKILVLFYFYILVANSMPKTLPNSPLETHKFIMSHQFCLAEKSLLESLTCSKWPGCVLRLGLPTVLVSCGSCNKLPNPGWLKPEVYFLPVLEAKSLLSVSLG